MTPTQDGGLKASRTVSTNILKSTLHAVGLKLEDQRKKKNRMSSISVTGVRCGRHRNILAFPRRSWCEQMKLLQLRLVKRHVRHFLERESTVAFRREPVAVGHGFPGLNQFCISSRKECVASSTIESLGQVSYDTVRQPFL